MLKTAGVAVASAACGGAGSPPWCAWRSASPSIQRLPHVILHVLQVGQPDLNRASLAAFDSALAGHHHQSGETRRSEEAAG